MRSRFVCLWEFRINLDLESRFLEYYGPNGVWSRLFRQAPEYVGTLLLKDESVAGRYVTVDRWESAEAYQAFRERCGQQYDDIDHLCEEFTLSEENLGSYAEYNE